MLGATFATLVSPGKKHVGSNARGFDVLIAKLNNLKNLFNA